MFQYEQEYENEIKPKWNLSSNKERKELEEFDRELKERKQAKIQAKLKVDKANSPQEKEADKIAKEVVNGKGDVKEKVDQLQVQAKGKEEGVEVSPEISNAIQSELGNGQALSQQEKDFFEPKFGKDFSGVKVHDDSKAHDLADSINAKAFTVGNDIFFNEGEYSLQTPEGKELLAHELAHTVQNESFNNPNYIKKQSYINTDPEKNRRIRAHRTYEEVLDLISLARKTGNNMAANLLEHYINGSGKDFYINPKWLLRYASIRFATDKNVERFIVQIGGGGFLALMNLDANEKEIIFKKSDDLKKKLDDFYENGEVGGSYQLWFKDRWDRLLYAPLLTELYYSSGGSNIKSYGYFFFKKEILKRLIGKDIVVLRIKGHIYHYWNDRYDWHAALGASIPYFGIMDDSDMQLLDAEYGFYNAKEFNMYSQWRHDITSFYHPDKSIYGTRGMFYPKTTSG